MTRSAPCEQGLGDVGQLGREPLRPVAQPEDRADPGAEELAVAEPSQRLGLPVRRRGRRQRGVPVVGQVDRGPTATPLVRVADHRQEVLGLGVEVILPEEVALPEHPDEGIEHLGPVQRGVFLAPSRAAPWSRRRTG